MSLPTRLGLTAASMVAVLFAVFVWPTKYRYSEMRVESIVIPLRTNRFTGTTERFWGQWLADSSQTFRESVQPTLSFTLPPADLQKVEVLQTGVLGDSKLSTTIYNGSKYTLDEVTVEVGVTHFQPAPLPPGISRKSARRVATPEREWLDAQIRMLQDEPDPPEVRVELPPRHYKLTRVGGGDASPLQASHWEADLGFTIAPVDTAYTISARIVSATGGEATRE